MSDLPTGRQTHKETLTKGKLEMLKQAANHVTATMQNDIPLSIFGAQISKYNNFQKLRYHGLIHHVRKNGQIVRGRWLITRNGWAFLRGEIQLPKYVFVANNEITGRADQTISVRDVHYGSDVIETTFQYFDKNNNPVGFRPVVAPRAIQVGLEF